jgi:hypothetical protein
MIGEITYYPLNLLGNEAYDNSRLTSYDQSGREDILFFRKILSFPFYQNYEFVFIVNT